MSEMVTPELAARNGLLPVRNMPVRFAVGSPNRITSNFWKVRATKSGVYLACRDNFKETKVSLHTSTDPDCPGRWRVGFATEALPKVRHLLPPGENRAWEVWDEPPPSVFGAVVAFRLFFPASELAVKPEQRTPKAWKDVTYIESAPPGKLTTLSLFVTTGEPENGFADLVRTTAEQAVAQMKTAGVEQPPQGYAYYFLGRQPDGCRFIFGARLPGA